jgi:predicted metalloprotease with PDZ domain
MSNELWCAEGFTQYYGQLLMVRAGLAADTNYVMDATGLIGAKMNTPGAANYTPIEASNEAVFVDAGVAVDKTNFQNISTSYYTYGGAIALTLDLTLRKQGKTLDQFMQQMWKVHGKPEKPYTVADMQTALAAITTPAFAKDFFDKYVYAPGKPDYESLLTQAGFALKKAAPQKAWIGRTQWTTQDGGLVIGSNTIRNTPLYDAGLDIGDAITSIDGTNISRESDLISLLNSHKPGDVLNVSYRHRGNTMQTKLTVAENPASYVVTYESLGQPVTDAIKAFRKSWLGAK